MFTTTYKVPEAINLPGFQVLGVLPCYYLYPSFYLCSAFSPKGAEWLGHFLFLFLFDNHLMHALCLGPKPPKLFLWVSLVIKQPCRDIFPPSFSFHEREDNQLCLVLFSPFPLLVLIYPPYSPFRSFRPLLINLWPHPPSSRNQSSACLFCSPPPPSLCAACIRFPFQHSLSPLLF